MVAGKRIPFARARELDGRLLLRVSIASALASGMLIATSAAEARTTKIDLQPAKIAFGGYSFAGVGQYEQISGVAYGEINPDDPQNALITDIGNV